MRSKPRSLKNVKRCPTIPILGHIYIYVYYTTLSFIFVQNKKGADAEESEQPGANAQDNQLEADEAAKVSPEEGASTTSSGEDSCESRPATADGNNLPADGPQP